MSRTRKKAFALFGLLFVIAMSVPGQAAQTIYDDEAAYLADLATLGYVEVAERFEDDNFWGLLETDAAPDVTSQGVTWTGLGDGVTLKHRIERSGDWGLESSPPGSPFDGFLATSSEPLFGFGGWIKAGNAGSGGQNDVDAFLNGSTVPVDGFGAPTSAYVFWGIIDTAGISSLQFETEPVDPPEPGSGDPIDPSKTFFLDDFTFGFTAAPSLREPGTGWTNLDGGVYAASGNWDSSASPATTDNALFHLGSAAPYTVNFSQNESASQAIIADDKVAFDLGGFQYDLTESNITRESLIVGERPGDVGELTLSNGTLSGANIVIAHSTTSTGHMTIDNGATVNLTGAMRVGSGGNGTLDINAGSAVTSGSTGVAYGGIVGQLNGTGTVHVAGAGARWDINSFRTLAVGLGGTGTLNISEGAAVSAWLLIAGSEAGNGLENEPVGMGTINVSGAGTTLGGGSIMIAQDGPASMNVTDGAQVTGRGGNIAVSADGNVVLDGPGSSWTMNIGGASRGTLNIGVGNQKGSFATTPPPPLLTGTMTIQNGASVVAEETFIGKTRTGKGILTVTGSGSSWSSGSQFLGNTFIGHEGDGVLNVLDGATVQTGQAMIGRHGLRDQLRGVANISGVGSTWTTPSTIWVGFNNDPQIYSGSGLFVAEGVLNVTEGGTVDAGQLSLAGRNISIGLVNISGSGSTLSANSVAFGKTSTTTFTFGSNAKMTIADGGVLNVTGNMDIYHGQVALDGGKINATNLLLHGEQLIDPATGQFETGDTRVTLKGYGSINANVTNSGGFVEPGLSVGLLNIAGEYSQAVQGTLGIELGGTDNSNPLALQYDQLLIEGSATLDGTLEVALIGLGGGDFSPLAGDRFDILTTTGGFTGEFSTQHLPALSEELLWNVNYGSHTVTLSILSSLLPADFDADGDVDADDLTHPTLGWQARYGSELDGADFLNWQRELGSSVGSLASSQTVPEPSAAALLILGFLGYRRLHR